MMSTLSTSRGHHADYLMQDILHFVLLTAIVSGILENTYVYRRIQTKTLARDADRANVYALIISDVPAG